MFQIKEYIEKSKNVEICGELKREKLSIMPRISKQGPTKVDGRFKFYTQKKERKYSQANQAN